MSGPGPAYLTESFAADEDRVADRPRGLEIAAAHRRHPWIIGDIGRARLHESTTAWSPAWFKNSEQLAAAAERVSLRGEAMDSYPTLCVEADTDSHLRAANLSSPSCVTAACTKYEEYLPCVITVWGRVSVRIVQIVQTPWRTGALR